MNDAELLVDIAEAVLHPREELIISESNSSHTTETVALAIKLRRNPAMALRAMMEEWDRFRIVRELY